MRWIKKIVHGEKMSEKGNLFTHYLSVFFGAVAGLSFSEWVSLGFLLIGLATFIINWYYKQKHYELTQKKGLKNAEADD